MKKQPTDNLYFIYGPPGSGKTTVSRLLAERLELPFIDLDEEIMAQAGKPIRDIFAEDGEKAFRRLEKAALTKAAALPAAVIALGGGALLDPSLRRLVEARGTVAVLECAGPVLESRMEREYDLRPLIGRNPDWRNALQSLLAARQAHYRSFPIQVNAELDREKVVEELQTRLGTWRIRGMGQPYDVRMQPGGLAGLGALLATRELGGPVVVVTDRQVWRHHRRTVLRSLHAAGYATTACVLPGGEAGKNLRTVARIWTVLQKSGIDRGGTLLALGGGVVGDLGGFAAATYLRGIRWVGLPTSLIAMVDSSLGGKTGFDLPAGKNLVGAFHPPALVLCDPQVIATLPQAERINGMAEVLKHGLIADPELWELTRQGLDRWNNDPDAWDAIIRRAAAVKMRVIEADPYEKGIRKSLNFGHTLGHAFEAASGYQLPHGHAVAIGMVEVTRLAAAQGLCDPVLTGTIRQGLEANHLPWQIPRHLNARKFLQALFADKKREAGGLRFVIVPSVGESRHGVELDIDFEQYAREQL